MSLFDWFNGGSAMEGPKDVVPYKEGAVAPKTGKNLVRTLSGEYIPRGPLVTQQPAGLLEGQVIEGERLPDSYKSGAVTKYQPPSQSVSQGVTNAVDDVARTGGAGVRGLLGKALGVAGSAPVAGVQLALTPGELGDGTLSLDQRRALGKQTLGEEEADRLAGNAVNAGKEYVLKAQGEAFAKNHPLVVPTQEGPKVPGAKTPNDVLTALTPKPTDTPQQTAQKQAIGNQIQAQSEQIGEQMRQRLASNQLSRPQAAAAVVDADAAKQGITYTPQQRQEAIQQEVASMRSMDNNQLGKYIGLALAGVGLAAALTDKSGLAAAAFGAAALKTYEDYHTRQDAKEALALKYGDKAEERKIKQQNADTNARKAELYGQDIQSKIGDREFDNTMDTYTLDQNGRKIDIMQQNANQTGAYQNGRLAQGAQGLSIRAQEMLNRKAYQDARLKMDGDKAKAAAEGRAAQNVPELSEKGASEMTKTYLSDQGYDTSDAVVSQVADQVRRDRKRYPNVPTETLVRAAIKKVGPKQSGKRFGIFDSTDNNLSMPVPTGKQSLNFQ